MKNVGKHTNEHQINIYIDQGYHMIISQTFCCNESRLYESVKKIKSKGSRKSDKYLKDL